VDETRISQLDSFLSLAEVADTLGLSQRMVRMIPPAELPYWQRGFKGRRKYHPLDLLRYVERYTKRT
jgi:hypothetical protein